MPVSHTSPPNESTHTHIHTLTHTHSYIADLNANITQLPSLGPYSKYDVPDEKVKGKLEFEWIGEVCVCVCVRVCLCMHQ